MIVEIYSINDVTVGFGSPYVQSNERVAVRNFMDNADKTGRNLLNDLELWSLGTMDDETGKIESNPKLILKGASIIKEGEKK